MPFPQIMGAETSGVSVLRHKSPPCCSGWRRRPDSAESKRDAGRGSSQPIRPTSRRSPTTIRKPGGRRDTAVLGVEKTRLQNNAELPRRRGGGGVSGSVSKL